MKELRQDIISVWNASQGSFLAVYFPVDRPEKRVKQTANTLFINSIIFIIMVRLSY